MPYLSLYRKYRPRNFAEIVGQRHVTQTLVNAVRSDRIAHAYLFCGPRGTGKTSTARVLAMALNCQEGTSPEPCGVCETCQRTLSGVALDVIEIDAASNRGIDEIRALRERVGLAPAESRYKVYIIDEVHMLTGEAFNAFLKTLEEPPRHVVFVLATTEPHRVLPTILSRCQRFDFHRVGTKEIEAVLQMVAEKEGIEVDEKAVAIIVHAADGSVRDALTLLDQAIAYAEGAVTSEIASEILGGIDFDLLASFAEILLRRDVAGALELVERVVAEGKDLRQLVVGLIGHYRNLLVASVDRRGAAALALPEEIAARVSEQARAVPPAEVVRTLDLLAETDREFRFTSQPRLLVELAAVRICQSAAEGKPAPPAQAAPAAERPAPRGRSASSSSARASKAESPPAAAPPSPPAPAPKSVSEGDAADTLSEIRRRWEEILAFLNRSTATKRVSSFLLEAVPTALSEGVLTLSFRQQFHHGQMTSESRKKVVAEAIVQVVGVSVAIRCELGSGDDPPGPSAGNQPPLIQDIMTTFPGSTVEE